LIEGDRIVHRARAAGFIGASEPELAIVSRPRCRRSALDSPRVHDELQSGPPHSATGL